MPDGEAWEASRMDALLADLARARIGVTFNQYAETGPDDIADGAAIRVANLRAYLHEREGADVVALGEVSRDVV